MIQQVINFCQIYGPQIESFFRVIQGIVIICATVFTVWWTHKTFAHKEAILELKKTKALVEEFCIRIQIFCTQNSYGRKEEKRKEEAYKLMRMDGELRSFYEQNLYIRPKIRNRINDIVGKWIADEKFGLMRENQGAELSPKEWKEMWRIFDSECKEVKKIIDNEAERYT